MKGFGFNTILLGLVLVKLLISFVVHAYGMYKLSGEQVGTTAPGFWAANKTILIIPGVTNIISMILLAVLVIANK